jgi:hypothetical protein
VRRLPIALLAALVALLVLIFGVGQLVLPGIAARHVRSMLAGSARGVSVSVSAFPAVQLLWHHADRVTVHLTSYTAGAGAVNGSLGQAGDVGRLQVTVGTARVGLLTVRDVRVTGRGGRLTGAATIDEADLRGTIPFLRSVTPIASSDGRLTLRGTADVLGFTGSLDADVTVQHGAIVVAPDGLLGSLATVTVFSDPQVAVRSVTAARTRGGFRVTSTARTH